MNKKFSIVIPVYKNELNLPITIPYIIENLNLFNNYDVELVLVNDGSPDNSIDIIREYKKKYPDLIKAVSLSRNFGQAAAIRCGFDVSTGDVIGVISADLQDPFELFVEMLKYWENGYKIVIATRSQRNEKNISVAFSKIFHKIVKKFVNKDYPDGGFDFFVIDKSIKDEYSQIDLVPAFPQLLLLSLGHKRKFIEYTRQKREKGKSGWTLQAKIDLAIGVLVYFSDFPLKIVLFGGIFLLLFSSIFIIVDLILLFTKVLNFNIIIDIGAMLLFFISIILIAIGIVGEYIYYNFKISKKYPAYIIED